jgi:two-component system, chemotaxis family, CheB/CheR fusion protein
MTEPTEGPTAAPPAETERSLNLVAIGASAGGIGALRALFEAVPEQSGIAFVVIMHLSPEHESRLAEVLQPHVKVPVRQVRERTRLEPDHVYVIPPDRSMALTDGHLELSEFDQPRGRRSPIDTFFRTVAEVHPDGVGILLSGSGTDGVIGLKAIKELGGIVMAQSPDEAEYDTMPRSAIATGLVDFVLPARELGERVVRLRSSGLPWTPPDDAAALRAGEAEALRKILAQLRSRTGHDFSGYKKSTVLRRVGRRIQVTDSGDLQDYLGHLQENGSEARALLKDLLISVTNFFRDPEAFEALERTVVPSLFEDPADHQVRVWVAGCATGEEAYTVAMLLAEHADVLPGGPSFQIFATDLDEEAIAFAREGVYPDSIVADVGEARARRFFTREGSYLRVTKELRERILFSRHDLLRDPPFSRLDLLTCRNLLIYLERGLQERLFDLFRYALRDDGYLFLGESESAPDHQGFRAPDREHRIFQRSQEPGDGERRGLPELPLDPGRARQGGRWPRGATAQQIESSAARHRQALEAHAPPTLLVDRDHIIVHVSETANRYLRFTTGIPSANLLTTALPELRIELRSALFQALEQDSPSWTRQVPVEIGGQPRRVQMHVAPAVGANDTRLALITFLEADPGQQGEEGVGATAVGWLGDAESELAVARSRLQEMIERSEQRQEDLKASNEELQSINEEYKSTLEELETSKEELQSMNEELKTVNAELKARIDELGRANDDLRNLMSATEIATLFLDENLRIKRFTPALRKIFNVLPMDEGRPLAHITHQLDYPDLTTDCDRVLESLQPVEREVENGGGHAWLARITPYRTEQNRIGGVICTFTDVTRIRKAQEHLRQSEERFRALVDATAEMVWTTDPEGRVVEDSPSWRDFTGQTVNEWLGSGWVDALHPDDRQGIEAEWSAAVRNQEPFEAEFRLWNAAREEWRVVAARAVPVLNPDGSVREWVGMNSDITDRKEAEAALRRAKKAAEQAAEAKGHFLATMSHELRTPLTAVIGIADLLETDVVGFSTEAQKEHLARIKISAWHLASIIEEVLSYSMTESGRTRVNHGTVDLVEIASHVVAMADYQAREKGVALDLEGADQPVFAFSDAGKIRQIVTNLVGNAVKFTDDGRVTVRVVEEDEWVEIQVQDTGPGIAEDQQEIVFEPFVQADNSMTREKGGAGLGLAVSRRLARLLGGEISLESEPAKGCTFRFTVPKKPESAPGG